MIIKIFIKKRYKHNKSFILIPLFVTIMRNLSTQEREIVRQLIRNPRNSDNRIARATGIPVMTVNRKRKNLEKEGVLRYFASLDTGEHGTGKYGAKQLYLIKFKIGITRHQFINRTSNDPTFHAFSACYISLSYIGEREGHLTYMCILDAETESKMMDEFNEKIVPYLKKKFGDDCIKEIISMRITNTIRRHHNYIPAINMENGIIRKDWPDNYIFVDEALDVANPKHEKESSI
jgi:DNA-binding Lrp family transcriptional regulator